MTPPIPKALYPCALCLEDYSWPPEDLHWSEKVDAWICDNCWDEDEHGEPEMRLSDVLAASIAPPNP